MPNTIKNVMIGFIKMNILRIKRIIEDIAIEDLLVVFLFIILIIFSTKAAGESLPTATDVAISGTPNVGEVLTGNYTFNYSVDEWTQVGLPNFSDGGTSYNTIILDNADTPYITYLDDGHGDAITVKKFDGASWVDVGAPGFSLFTAFDMTIDVDSSGVPYVAFINTGSGSRVHVYKFNGVAWEEVGPASSISAGSSGYSSIKLDSLGVPYVAFSDGGFGGKTTVKKYNSGTDTWDLVGPAGFSADIASFVSLVLDSSDTPYVAYTDGGFGNKATLMKYNSGTDSWDLVGGSAGFSAGASLYTSLALDSSDTPYVAFQDGTNVNKATVMKFSGSWQTVGTAGFSAGQVRYTPIVIDSSDVPYVAFVDDGSSPASRATVMKFEDGTWVNVGPAGGISAGEANGVRIALDSSGVPYVSYSDVAFGGYKTNVVKLTLTSHTEQEGTSTFRWYRNDAEISGETSSTYTVLSGDQGKTIKFEVTPTLVSLVTGDQVQSDGVVINYLVPVIDTISPNTKTSGDPAFILNINGSNFSTESVARINGGDRVTTFISDTELTAEILASDIAVAGDKPITVFNPTPAGGESNAVTLLVNQRARGGGGTGPSTCPSGYTGTPPSCSPINPCIANPSLCNPPPPTCPAGTIGIYPSCVCPTNYTMQSDGTCKKNSPPPPPPTCEELGTCINSGGGDGTGGGSVDAGGTGGGQTGGGGSVTPPSGGGGSVVTPPIESHPNILGDTISRIKQIFNSSYGDPISKIIAAVGLIIGALGVVGLLLFATPMNLSELVLLPTRLWSLLLTAFGIKKEVRPWGTVYDSVTKQPLDPVYLTLVDKEQKEIATALTDLDGRYGFLVSPGWYMLRPKKTDYDFPSIHLGHLTRDEVYLDLYFGNYFEIKTEGEVITKNIPMDPINFNWNEVAKQDQNLLRFYSKRDVWYVRVSGWFFGIGFAIALLALIFAPKPYNIAIFALYLVLLVIKETGVKLSKLGSVIDKATGAPLSFAIIRVFSYELGNEVIHKVTTEKGLFYCLVPNSSYYITIEKKNPDGTYTQVFKSEKIDVTKGVLKGKFEVVASDMPQT